MSTALRKKMHQDLQLAGLSEGTQDVYLLRARTRSPLPHAAGRLE